MPGSGRGAPPQNYIAQLKPFRNHHDSSISQLGLAPVWAYSLASPFRAASAASSIAFNFGDLPSPSRALAASSPPWVPWSCPQQLQQVGVPTSSSAHPWRQFRLPERLFGGLQHLPGSVPGFNPKPFWGSPQTHGLGSHLTLLRAIFFEGKNGYAQRSLCVSSLQQGPCQPVVLVTTC